MTKLFERIYDQFNDDDEFGVSFEDDDFETMSNFASDVDAADDDYVDDDYYADDEGIAEDDGYDEYNAFDDSELMSDPSEYKDSYTGEFYDEEAEKEYNDKKERGLIDDFFETV